MHPIHRPLRAGAPGFENIRVCQKIDDLYLQAARDTLYNSIPGFFEDNMLSPTELLHCADWVGTLENTDMMLRTAIQRGAMRNVHHVANIKQHMAELEQLTRDATRRLLKDTRGGIFPPVTDCAEFSGLADRLVTTSRGRYILNGIIARHVLNSDTPNDKLCRLVHILESTNEENPGWSMLHEAVDTILAELIRIPALVDDIIGDTENFGDHLLAIVRLFLSRPVNGKYGRGQATDLLSWHFAAGELPQTRIALGQMLKNGLASQKVLCEGGPRNEMERFKQISRLIVQCIGPHLKRRDIQPALDLRSSRLASPEMVHACLQQCQLPSEKIKKLFFIESCITDARSRYRIADILFRLSTADSFSAEFQRAPDLVMERMHTLADLNRAAITSGFDPDQRQKMASIFDHMAYELAKNSHLFEGIDKRYQNIAQKTVTIARMFYSGHITEGKLSRKARKQMMNYTRMPGFLEAYIIYRTGRDGKTLDARQALIDIGLGMKRVGIDPEIGLYWVMPSPA